MFLTGLSFCMIDGNMSWSYEFDGDVISAAYDRGCFAYHIKYRGRGIKPSPESRVVVLKAGEICWTEVTR